MLRLVLDILKLKICVKYITKYVPQQICDKVILENNGMSMFFF